MSKFRPRSEKQNIQYDVEFVHRALRTRNLNVTSTVRFVHGSTVHRKIQIALSLNKLKVTSTLLHYHI